MPPSPVKAREGRKEWPHSSAASSHRTDMRDISNLAVTGSGLIEPRERKAVAQHNNDNHHSIPAEDSVDNSTAHMSPLHRSPTAHPTSPRSTRSSRLRRQLSLSNRPDSSAAASSSSLEQLGAVHQQLQAMITSKADEHNSHITHNQPSTEATATHPPASSQPHTASPSSSSTSPLLQRLMALVREAESQQQHAQHTASATSPQHRVPTAVSNTAFSSNSEQVVRALLPASNEAPTYAPMQPSLPHPHNQTHPTAAEPSVIPSTSSSVAARTTDTSCTAAMSVQQSQTHLSQQLRQLSEYKEQAVAECVAAQARLQSAITQLQSLQAQCSNELLCIEREYVSAVEQCTTQHTHRLQRMHES